MDQPIDQESSGKTMASFIPIVSTEAALATQCWSASALDGGCPGLMDSFSESIAILQPKDLVELTTLNLNSVFQNLLSNQNLATENHRGNLAKIRILAFLTINWNPNQDDLNVRKSLMTMNIKMYSGMFEIKQSLLLHYSNSYSKYRPKRTNFPSNTDPELFGKTQYFNKYSTHSISKLDAHQVDLG